MFFSYEMVVYGPVNHVELGDNSTYNIRLRDDFLYRLKREKIGTYPSRRLRRLFELHGVDLGGVDCTWSFHPHPGI